MDSHEENDCARFAERDRQARIRELNDALRCDRRGGYYCLTSGIVALGLEAAELIQIAVAEFSDFRAENDPYHEHDFGALTVQGRKVFWKIDYFDINERFGSPDPSDPSVTSRIMTIMLADEY